MADDSVKDLRTCKAPGRWHKFGMDFNPPKINLTTAKVELILDGKKQSKDLNSAQYCVGVTESPHGSLEKSYSAALMYCQQQRCESQDGLCIRYYDYYKLTNK